MTISDRELAFFGGWRKRTMTTGGTHRWGDPRWRNHELAPSAGITLILPDDSPWMQTGVPYLVVNSGTANIMVVSPDGDAVLTITPGVGAEFIKGAKWTGWPVSTVQFGSIWPSTVLDITVSSNTSRINMLELAIAQHGYDGSASAAIQFRVASGVAVGTDSIGWRALTTGNTVGSVSWAAGSFARLVVDEGAISGGWGGYGGPPGVSGTGGAVGLPGGDGGQAIRAEIPLRIDCPGIIMGGGGGGGGGSGSTTNLTIEGGGGGGGRGVNMAVGSGVLTGSPGAGGGGTSGTTFASGAGGPGQNGGGNGGAGGGAGQNGIAASSGGAGGIGGAAISYLPAAGMPTILSGGSNILGAIVAEAS